MLYHDDASLKLLVEVERGFEKTPSQVLEVRTVRQLAFASRSICEHASPKYWRGYYATSSQILQSSDHENLAIFHGRPSRLLVPSPMDRLCPADDDATESASKKPNTDGSSTTTAPMLRHHHVERLRVIDRWAGLLSWTLSTYLLCQ